MVGIYKITNPKGKIYIGQSINLEKRKREYSKLQSCKNQKKLYTSLIKYGFNSHNFEIIEQCTILELNIRERYWQDFYNVLSKEGLNCLLTRTNDKAGKCSKEVAEKIGNSNRGKKKPPRTEQHRRNLSESLQGNVISSEARQKIREANIQRGQWKGAANPSARAVQDLQTGIIYSTVREAAKTLNIKPATLQAWLSGVNRNKSTMTYL